MTLILPLTGHHDRKGFDCGDAELNGWLRRFARQHSAKGVSTTYVAVETETGAEVFGYYAISVTELQAGDVPKQWQRKLPDKIPAYRIGRLAVAEKYQRKGLGGLLLANAISRLQRISSEVGGSGIVVDAKSTAIGFYLQYGFEQLADHPSKLFLPI
ncbi:MAG: GNAT family N-acetyltransferase [Gammaproteobacteria bacterium]|nr:GNAT family N-acetyltransferase [Gammaproteobacteria bacterium]MBU1655176.1 GNAT family N-acetyltransferase [Gammaproteobacteria bacterium]MBU1959987.1 GNAT family N-acetyltransferase [Gammaproteobacteria bacterium]